MKYLSILFVLFTTLTINTEPKYVVDGDNVIILQETKEDPVQEIARVDLRDGTVYLVNPRYEVESTIITDKETYTVAIETRILTESYLYLSERRKVTEQLRNMFIDDGIDKDMFFQEIFTTGSNPYKKI